MYNEKQPEPTNQPKPVVDLYESLHNQLGTLVDYNDSIIFTDVNFEFFITISPLFYIFIYKYI